MNDSTRPVPHAAGIDAAPASTAAVASIIASVALTAIGNGLMFAYIPVSLGVAGFPPTWAGAILTALSAGGLVACLTTGALVRRVGHARAFMIFSALIILSNTAIAAGVHPFPWIAARALYGFAISGMFIVAQSWLNDAVSNAIRGRAMAILGIGGAASNAAFPTISQQLIEMFGWRETYMILGVFVWLLILPLAIFVVRNRPEDRGEYPDGADEVPEAERKEAESNRAPESAGALRTWFFWVTALSIGVPSMVSTAFIFHQISILTEFGLSASMAAGLFVPFAIAATVSSFAGGYLVDRFNPIRVYTINAGVFVLGTLVLVSVTSPLHGFVYAGLMGLFQGVQMIIMHTTWAYLYGRRGLGNVQGAGSMTNIAYSAIGPLPLAALHGYFGDFRPAILILGGLMIISAITVNLVRKEAHGVAPDSED
jgi:MFS family permease